ncbi:tetratricopeptide repeat protein [Chryseobacterium sp. Mn2064]|uniref:tetratricopeptide repeat protein n=1 Tax=Chryseobacterium sp. Mn2064 TaxID=3395263 RepID=UPI003BD013A8
MQKIFIFLFLPSFLFAQYSSKEIDSLMTKEYYRLREQRKFEEIIIVSRQVIQDSKEINYLKGEIYGYTRLGNMQYNVRDYQEALRSLNYADKLVENSNFQDNMIRTSIHLGTGLCYSEFGSSYHNACLQYDKALIFAGKIENNDERIFYRHLIYSNLYGLYSHLNNKGKQIFYLRKALSVKPTSYILTELARYHNVYSKNLDSARFYLEKSEKKADTDFAKAALYNQWAKYYEEKKEFRKAIDFYVKNEILARKTKEAPLQEEALVGLFHCYKEMGNLEKAVLYSEKRNIFKDSIRLLQSKNSEMAIKDIIAKNEKITRQKFSSTQKVLIAFFVLVLITIVFFALKTYRKERKKALEMIEEREGIISIKEEENQKLQQKVNDSFDEIIALARSNSPQLLIRFKEVYPDYYGKLEHLEPKLLTTEIKLCVMIFLGFTTKDIAEYNFVTISAVQHRKYRLRKKLSIPSDVEIHKWIVLKY